MQIEFPGLFDLQVNGFGGVDFNNPSTTVQDVARAIAMLKEAGTIHFLPTLITSSFEQFAKCAGILVRASQPAIVGIHMEGPYIAIKDGPRGAHPREHVAQASVDDFKRRQEAAGGAIRLVTLAPEVPGAIQLTEYLVSQNVRVAIGHTAANSEQIRDAIWAGATLSTHLGNGCANPLPRHPNLIWDQLAADELHASFIVDGHHLPPATVKVMLRAKSPERTILVSDSIAAAGCPPGKYELGGQVVELSVAGRVSPPGQPWLAGSALKLADAIGRTVQFTGLPLKTVLAMATSQPAAYLGLQTSGQITADWNENACRLEILKVMSA